MLAIRLSEFGSTLAPEMSSFHALSAGKTCFPCRLAHGPKSGTASCFPDPSFAAPSFGGSALKPYRLPATTIATTQQTDRPRKILRPFIAPPKMGSTRSRSIPAKAGSVLAEMYHKLGRFQHINTSALGSYN